MGAFGRSWELTKATLEVMKKDKEIFIFPILAIISSILFLILFGVFSFIFGAISIIGGLNIAILGYILLFILYLFLAIISTFFAICVIYTASIRFNGKDATFKDSLSFALKKLDKIILWAILSATVGLILKILENIAEKMKGVGKILLNILNFILGTAWSISTIFVLQGIVYKDLGPFASIKESLITLKKTWGESLIKYIGFGMAEFVLLILGIIVFLPLLFFSLGNITILLILIGILIIYIASLTIFFNLADSVYNTALYIYANTGKLPKGFTEEQVKGAFKPKTQMKIIE